MQLLRRDVVKGLVSLPLLIGGPFEGKYRNASVVHGFYCQVRTRPYRDAHKAELPRPD